ncbi:MAG: exosortase/archaeosortase family protein [Euryarchaeota archaeon]
MVSTATSSQKPDDLDWSEVAQLGLRYAKIPLALLCVEAFYWFLTMPSDTLAPIQVSEAWLWHGLTNLLYGEGAATLGMHNGWMTRIELNHVDFPGSFNHIALYVSDECAGVHEMIFLSTLVAMTEGVPQRIKIRSILVMCSIIYVLNLLRLVVFYPIALQDCVAMPNEAACLTGMWTWHTAVYEWGFLVVLIGMWLIWFWRVGGPARTLDATSATPGEWRLVFRKVWAKQQLGLVILAGVLIAAGAYNVTSNVEAMEAKATLDTCNMLDLITSECGQAQNRWDDAIGYAWSLSALGLLAGLVGGIEVQRPDEEGKWPMKQVSVRKHEAIEKSQTSRHNTAKKGSWKSRSEEE